MVDRDLAVLYGVVTKSLNQAVRRNIERFPDDFMFQMTKQEMAIWKSQIVTSNRDKKGLRKQPLVFTEQGVSMLSSVLKSKQAIQVNIQIVRTFIKIREILATNKELREKVEKLETKYDQQFTLIFKAIQQLLATPEKTKPNIGFRTS